MICFLTTYNAYFFKYYHYRYFILNVKLSANHCDSNLKFDRQKYYLKVKKKSILLIAVYIEFANEPPQISYALPEQGILQFVDKPYDPYEFPQWHSLLCSQIQLDLLIRQLMRLFFFILSKKLKHTT